MKMPGFTAETSLYRSGRRFTIAGAPDAPTKGATVVPQACVNLGPCRVCISVRGPVPKACVTFSCLGFNRSFCIP